MDSAEPIASTPRPPYFSVIFTSCRAEGNHEAYAAAADRMLELAAEQDGFLGVESARDQNGVGITVSYWRDLDAIRLWHDVAEHKEAQSKGRSLWYDKFAVRICRVERHYDFDRSDFDRSDFDRSDFDRSDFDRNDFDRNDFDRNDFDRNA